MRNSFYIVKVNDENWYRLHVLPSHYCLGASTSVEPLVRTVVQTTMRCKNTQGLNRNLLSLEDKGEVSEKMTEVYQRDYVLSGYGERFKDLVLNAVEEGLKKYRDNSPLGKSLLRHTVKRSETPEPPVVETNEPPKFKSGIRLLRR